MNKTIAVIAAVIAAGVSYAFELVGPTSCARVVLASEAEPSSRLAADELVTYVRKVTGRTLEVEIEGDGERGGSVVRIGTLGKFPGEIPAAILKRLDATEKAEAACLAAQGDTLWIVGKEEVAELYATYHFLESELGVRWFQAATKEDDGEYVPKAQTLFVQDFARLREPFFTFRRLDNTGVAALPPPSNGVACAVRNGYQVLPAFGFPVPYGKPDAPNAFFIPRAPRRLQSLGGGHLTFVTAMEGGKHFKEHPEWFALVDGKRMDGGHHMQQYCVSNPEVRQRVTDYILRQLREKNGVGRFLFGDVDTPHGACMCANCAAMDSEGERTAKTSRISHTTRFVKVVNDICGKVFAEFPKADLWMWAYLSYRELPQEGVRPDPRLKLYFCTHGRCYGHAFDDPTCERNVQVFGLLKAWREMLPRSSVYEYLQCTPNPYTPNEAVQAHDLKLFRGMGMLGWKEEAHFSDSKMTGRNVDEQRQRFPSDWQWLYTTGKLLWNPDLDVNELLADAESKYYGVAYPAMKKYHELRRKLWNNHPAHLGYSTGDQRRAVLLNRAGAKEELLAYLDEADRLAGEDSRLKFRLARDRRWLNDYWIKPNEEIRALKEKTLRIPKAKSAPVIDGDGSDAAWVSAFYATDFARQNTLKNPKPIDPELATSVGLLYDDENLYFLLSAKEPSPEKMTMRVERGADVWADDGFEIFLFPPSVENACYHLAVNAKGNVWGTAGGRVNARAFGAEAKGRVEKDRYLIELKMPLKEIAPIRVGEAWKVHFGRNRKFSDEAVPNGMGNYGYEGVGYTDVLSYRPAEFGSPYLRNGSFEELDAKGGLKGWEKPYGGEIVKGAGGNVLKLTTNQCILQTMWHGALRQAPKPRHLRFTLKASGQGDLKVWFRRWRDTNDSKAKHGYRREILDPSLVGGEFALTPEQKAYSGELEVPADEWLSIAVSCTKGEAVVDDVMVEPLVK